MNCESFLTFRIPFKVHNSSLKLLYFAISTFESMACAVFVTEKNYTVAAK